MRLFLFTLLICFLTISCTTYQPNPEFTACVNGCREAKNTCMVKAGTPAAITKCDEANAACMEKCSMIPPQIIVK
jgi:hypothetical protein